MATMHHLDDDDDDETETITTYTWRIENFSKLEESEVYSDTFLVGGRKWRILVHPNEEEDKFLPVYMNLADSETDPRIVPAIITFSVVNQQNSESSVTETFSANFRQGRSASLVPRADLHPKGFIVNDTLIVEAQVSPLDLPANANGNTGSFFSRGNVQLACRMLEEEISADIDRWSDSSTLQQKREKLAGFFDMSVESLCQTKSLDEFKSIALDILVELEGTDGPDNYTLLKSFFSLLDEMEEIVLDSLSTIETSLAIESSKAQITKDLRERLLCEKGELSCLNAEIHGLRKESLKLDAGIQQLAASKAKILDQTNSTAIKLQKGIEEASKLRDELKKKHEERQQVGNKRMRAMDNLAQSNARWKLFKDKLGW